MNSDALGGRWWCSLLRCPIGVQLEAFIWVSKRKAASKFCRALATRGARACSICSSVFVFAAAGVLDGRGVTTHWRYAQRLVCLPVNGSCGNASHWRVKCWSRAASRSARWPIAPGSARTNRFAGISARLLARRRLRIGAGSCARRMSDSSVLEIFLLLPLQA